MEIYRRLNHSYRYEGLVDYISSRYSSAVEIGIGHFSDVAFALLKKGMRIFATDVRPFQYSGLKVIADDIMEPNLLVYSSADLNLIYSLRPPIELVPFMIRLAKTLATDLIIKPLSSEHPGGKLIRHDNTNFLLWSFR